MRHTCPLYPNIHNSSSSPIFISFHNFAPSTAATATVVPEHHVDRHHRHCRNRTPRLIPPSSLTSLWVGYLGNGSEDRFDFRCLCGQCIGYNVWEFGFFKDAAKVFDLMPQRNLVTKRMGFLKKILMCSWNSIILGCSKGGKAEQAFQLLYNMQMVSKHVKPDQVTILSVLKVCVRSSQQLKVKELHGYLIRQLIETYPLVANAFVAAYSRCECRSLSCKCFCCAK